MHLKHKQKRLIPLIVTILLFGIIYLIGKSIPEESIRQLINKAGPMGPVVFILFMLLTYIFAPLSGTPVLFVGFYAFGKNVIFFASIAAFIASITNFWIARIWGRSIIEKLIGKDEIHKVDKFTQNYGLLALFISRIFLKGYHDIISYAAGLTSIKFSRYLIISTIGMIPGVSVWYFLASLVDDPVSFTIITIVEIFIFALLFGIGSLIIKKYKKINIKVLSK